MIVGMENVAVAPEPPAKPTRKTKKRKMSAAGRKAISDAAKERWRAKQAGVVMPPPVPVQVQPATPQPAPPSPAVLALQEQVVQRVSQRDEVRQRLTEAHTAYLLAQSRFQAAEAELKGIEQEVSYRIGLIAQLENRPQQASAYAAIAPLQFPPSGSLAGVSSEPSQPLQTKRGPQTTHATGDAGDLRREIQRGMM